MASHILLISLVAGTIGWTRPCQSGDLAVEFAERCRKILDRQVAILDGTRDLHKAIQDSPDQRPRPKDRRAALRLATGQADIILEATRTIETVKAEEVTVALRDVLREVRKDMEGVERRLKIGDVGVETQALEGEIIGTLKEMIAGFRER